MKTNKFFLKLSAYFQSLFLTIRQNPTKCIRLPRCSKTLIFSGVLFFQYINVLSEDNAEYINSRYGYKFSLPESTCIKKEASRLVNIYRDEYHTKYRICVSGVSDIDLPEELSSAKMTKQIQNNIEQYKFGKARLQDIESFTINQSPAVKYFYKINYFENAGEQHKEWVEETFTSERFRESFDNLRPMTGITNWIGMHSIHLGMKYTIDCDIPDEELADVNHLITEIINSFSYISKDIYKNDDIKSISCKEEDVFELPDIPQRNYSEDEINLIRLTANRLKDENKFCLDNYINKYQDNSYKHCKQTGYADTRAGGCAHYFRLISIEVIAAGLEECNIELP